MLFTAVTIGNYGNSVVFTYEMCRAVLAYQAALFMARTFDRVAETL
jgi:hypothetical protein